jgi:hypothetical protein
MPAKIRRAEYFYLTVKDRPGEAYRLLSQLASGSVNLLAFSVVPMGGDSTQLMVFPEDVQQLRMFSERAKLTLVGPQAAFLIQGDDELGALVEIHHKLSDAQINVSASSGVTDGRGGFGYIVYVAPQDFERATRVLEA